MWVRDAIGRSWRVELPFLPWQRVIKPFFFFTDEKRQSRAGMRVDTRTANQRARAERLEALETGKASEPLSSGEKVAVTALVLISLPQLVGEVLAAGLFSLLLLPLAAVEMFLQVVAGGVLWLWRVWGWASSRVVVYGCQGSIIHSMSVFDVPGRAAARRMAGELATSLSVTSGPFVPNEVPAIRAAGAVRKFHASGW